MYRGACSSGLCPALVSQVYGTCCHPVSYRDEVVQVMTVFEAGWVPSYQVRQTTIRACYTLYCRKRWSAVWQKVVYDSEFEAIVPMRGVATRTTWQERIMSKG